VVFYAFCSSCVSLVSGDLEVEVNLVLESSD
jgi:hypothetical protein